MRHRSHLPSQERAARSKLTQLLHDHPLIRGSLVTMARTCGHAGCKCYRGEKHLSTYLSVRLEGDRKMIYVPRELEDNVRAWVETHRETERLLDHVSQACLTRFLERKKGEKGEENP